MPHGVRAREGASSRIASAGRVVFTADAHRDNGQRFIVHGDEKLTVFLELENVTRESLRFSNTE